MRFKFFFALTIFSVLSYSCSNDSTPNETVKHTRPVIGNEYDESWQQLSRDGQQLPTSRSDTMMVVVATDSTVYGRSNVVVLGMVQPQSPNFTNRAIYLRVNAQNDLEVIHAGDDYLFRRWVTLPVQTRTEKTMTLDTTIYEGSEALHVNGTVRSNYDGDTTVVIDGNSINAIKLRWKVELEGIQEEATIVQFTGDRRYLYAPSLGVFVFVENIEDVIDPDGEHYTHTKQVMLRYRLK